MKKRIIFRLPDSMYEQINALIREGKWRNTSQIVREALKEFLAKNRPLDDILREAFSTVEGEGSG
ncbi:MAG: ribbon-helix-helix domain-containing protein [Fervidobacterium sp.]